MDESHQPSLTPAGLNVRQPMSCRQYVYLQMVKQSRRLSVCSSVRPFVHLSIRQSTQMTVHQSIRPDDCPSYVHTLRCVPVVGQHDGKDVNKVEGQEVGDEGRNIKRKLRLKQF